MLKINLTAEGLLDPRRFDAWKEETQRAMRTAVGRAMRDAGPGLAEAARSGMRGGFQVRKAAFLSSMRAKVFDRKKQAFPALYVGSKIPWLGLHEQGGTIRGRMLIPLLPQHRRIGRKAFKRVIEALLRSGNAYFLQKNGKTILMAENLSESARALSRFKRAERERTGTKRIARGQEIPVAVLVRQVALRKRFDLRQSVQRELPRLAQAIQTALSGV